MKARIVSAVMFTCLLGGCTAFQDVGQGAKDVGSTVQDDFKNIGPTMKKGFSDIKEGFKELGQGAAGDAKESVEEIKR